MHSCFSSAKKCMRGYYFRTVTSNLTSGSSRFLFHRNVTGRQRVNVKMKFWHRREMFMVSIWKKRFSLKNDVVLPDCPSKRWGSNDGVIFVLKETESFSENGLENPSGNAQRSISRFYKRFLFSWLILTFFVSIERVTLWAMRVSF